MSRPRFLADHNLNEHVVAGVMRREPAVEIVRARDVGYAARPDAELLEFAAGEGFLIVSHDVNTMPAAAFARLTAGEPVAGLLMVQQAEPVGPVIDNLVLIWSATDSQEWVNQVVFLPLH